MILIAVLVVLAIAIDVAIVHVFIQGAQEQAGEQQSKSSVWDMDNKSLGASSSARTSLSAEMQEAKGNVQELVAQYGSDVAVNVTPLDGSPGFSINGNKSFASASMIKLLVLAEFADEVDAGVRSLDSMYTRSADDVVGGTGTIQDDAPGTTYTYDDLARYMIMYSDNTATNVLIESMGMSRINAKADELGLHETNLRRKMMDLSSGIENHTSANDAATILVGIANRTLASKSMCEKAESYLLSQTDSDGLAEGLPANVTFGHKTGTLDSVRHDGGIVYTGSPYAIVVLTNLDSSEANELMSDISSTVYNALG